MGVLSRIFGFKKTGKGCDMITSANCPEEYHRILTFNNSLDALLSEDRYIARSDYMQLVNNYSALPPFIETLEKSQMLKTYAETNALDLKIIKNFTRIYYELANTDSIPAIIKRHNDNFILKHLKEDNHYLDDILKECDPNIRLDDEQREVVLSNEDYTLVIAGAGAGKTTTVAAKVRYLVEKQGISPGQILVISFTNKAVNELKERINHNLKINCPISTFHSIGNTIMGMNNEEKRRIVSDGYIFNVINRYLKENVLQNSELVEKLILFFGSYFTAPYEGNDLAEYFHFISKAEFSTIKSNIQEYIGQVIDLKTKEIKTLNNEVLRSQEEVNIANFLYLNQIDYEYEPFYQFRILDSNKPYTPDFVIRQGDKITYIEHFGITQSGNHSLYSQSDLEKYKKRINDKIKLHKRHQTDLIYTFSQYNDGSDYIEHLKEELLARGYLLEKRSSEEVYKKIVNSEETKYIVRLVKLICNFISNFKTQGYKEEQFDIFKSKTKNVRTRLFLDICRTCYLEYQKCLIQDNCTDFQDMINESTELIRKKKIAKEQLGYKYIIVDEYQDILRQRYQLIKELSALCDAKIVAVGDDWQSIYAFSGSILPLFTHFCEEFGYGQELKITRTYRNAQELINIAGNFVQRNSEQIRKSLISNKRINNPVIIETYSDKKCKNGEEEPKGGIYYYLSEAVNRSIQEILEQNKKDGKKGMASILLIGRYGFDARNMCNSEGFNYDERTKTIYSTKFGKRVKLSFLTAHSSKGLSADNVIIINAKDEFFGFPSQIEDDPVLSLVINQDESYSYAEERRLFYVALTRTKNRVFIIAPENKPSEFIKELITDKHLYPNVILNGNLNQRESHSTKDRCPICGYPMQRRVNKNYGLELWMCMNDQEVCGFMTNDKRGGNLEIKKCDWCKDGYLVVKPGKDGHDPFLGCTNYQVNGTGCNRRISNEHYLKWTDNSIGKEFCSAGKHEFHSHVITEFETPMPPQFCTPKKVLDTKKEKTKTIHTTSTQTHHIEQDGFEVVCDANGNILTDMDLLAKLRAWRANKAKATKMRPYWIYSNVTLVDLSTRKPITREELLATYGIGQKKVEQFGDEIIKIIKDHNNASTPNITNTDLDHWDADWPEFS